ncbi:MAG: ribonuclease R [Desulfohalobiaceae bacterium]|nr:ribonuclease R [Desulfohalobiaceae bacterium]
MQGANGYFIFMSKKKKISKIQKGPDRLLQLFHRSDHPLSLKKILRSFAPKKHHKKEILERIEELVASNRLISLNRGRAFVPPDKLKQIKGRLEMTASGAGFLLPEEKGHADVYISPDDLGGAWPGDTVIAAVLPGRRGKKPEGRVIRIKERRMAETLVVLTRKTAAHTFAARAMDRYFQIFFLVDVRPLKGKAEPGEVLVVKTLRQLEAGMFKAEALYSLGREESVQVQESIVKIQKEISREFPEKVLEAAGTLPLDPDVSDFEAREDLRALGFVTIDGEDAKDFDDAVFVYRQDGTFRLIVAIADVSHYVQADAPLDQEAAKRGNSFYFPLSVEPMFPGELSNGLCSLLPDRDRLVMAVDMNFSRTGERTDSRFYPALIRSRARLTYTQVKKGVLQEEEEVRNEIRDQLPMLHLAEQLARTLNAKRKQRGSLDFDLPEPEIGFDSGDAPTHIRYREHHFGHQIIEECMLAANEAVAEFLGQNGFPCLYRIHPEPDPEKILSLFNLLSKSDLQPAVPETADPKSLQQLLQKAAGTKQEFLVNRLLLRSMMQAAYSAKNKGHYGLAAAHYCHFTSPIRRYADLMVHRILKTALGLSRARSRSRRSLENMALHLNDQERKGVDAEREIHKRLTIIYLMDKIGERFTGLVSSVAEKGFWVELDQIPAEGLVRLDTLPNDYFVLIPEEQRLRGRRTGKTFGLGDQVRVRLSNCSLSRLEIDLEIEN